MSEFWLNVKKKAIIAFPEVMKVLINFFSYILRSAKSIATDVLKTILGKS